MTTIFLSADAQIFEEAFDGMFQGHELPIVPIDTRVSDPGPPVPLDSGLVYLIACALILAFWNLRKMGLRKSEPMNA